MLGNTPNTLRQNKIQNLTFSTPNFEITKWIQKAEFYTIDNQTGSSKSFTSNNFLKPTKVLSSAKNDTLSKYIRNTYRIYHSIKAKAFSKNIEPQHSKKTTENIHETPSTRQLLNAISTKTTTTRYLPRPHAFQSTRNTHHR
jgi:hypothetical protein